MLKSPLFKIKGRAFYLVLGAIPLVAAIFHNKDTEAGGYDYERDRRYSLFFSFSGMK
jgi:hypothetical protein